MTATLLIHSYTAPDLAGMRNPLHRRAVTLNEIKVGDELVRWTRQQDDVFSDRPGEFRIDTGHITVADIRRTITGDPTDYQEGYLDYFPIEDFRKAARLWEWGIMPVFNQDKTALLWSPNTFTLRAGDDGETETLIGRRPHPKALQLYGVTIGMYILGYNHHHEQQDALCGFVTDVDYRMSGGSGSVTILRKTDGQPHVILARDGIPAENIWSSDNYWLTGKVIAA